MSKNSSSLDAPAAKPKRSLKKALAYVVLLPVCVATAFVSASLIVAGVLIAVKSLGWYTPVENDPVLATVSAALVYSLALAIAVGIPYLYKKTTSLKDLGLGRLVSWLDIFSAPAALVVYMVFSGLLMVAMSSLFPSLDMQQVQDVGFSNLSSRYQYVLAFLTLVVIAPIAEEALFRGYLYGKLKKYVPLWVAVVVTSLLFGAAHGQWNVAIDTFALSVVMCALREMTGSIWAGILLHMTKNGIAFYFLFINPSILSTLGG